LTDLPARGAIGKDIDIGARENRPRRCRCRGGA
jgi:hypothetical protein